MSHWCVNSMARIIMLLPLMLTCLGIPAWAANPVAVSKDSAFMKQYRRAMKLAKQEDWDEAVDAFKAAYEAQPVEIPAVAGLHNGVWFRIRQGVRGLIVEADEVRAAYMLVEPASYYYKIMTRSERMPVLIGEHI